MSKHVITYYFDQQPQLERIKAVQETAFEALKLVYRYSLLTVANVRFV